MDSNAQAAAEVSRSSSSSSGGKFELGDVTVNLPFEEIIAGAGVVHESELRRHGWGKA